MQTRAQRDVLQKTSEALPAALPPGTLQRTLAIIMGGGAGTRLFPLTKDRAKPAVPLGGKYRIVDIPISNCLNSGLRSIYVLTQFNSMSLHRHIQASYKFDNFSRNFVDILAAQQTPEGSQWYQGTADAVRQNMRYFLERPFDYYLILSGDQLYRTDFGKHVIPESIEQRQVSGYIFNGYWEDIGTIRAFYEANLDLTDLLPQYSFFEASSPIYTHPRFLPGSKINGATLRQAIIADGCIISDAHIERSVIGVRSTIESGATIRNSIVMGADYYETDASTDRRRLPAIGIGRNCVIDRAIIDKNARIADGVVITPEGKPGDLDAGNYFIRDGIVVVPKNAVIPAGFWI